MRWRLTVWRRKWCMRRGHPMADWSPVTMRFTGADRMLPDGTIDPGEEITLRAWRCARHDHRPNEGATA